MSASPLASLRAGLARDAATAAAERYTAELGRLLSDPDVLVAVIEGIESPLLGLYLSSEDDAPIAVFSVDEADASLFARFVRVHRRAFAEGRAAGRRALQHEIRALLGATEAPR